MSRKVLVAWVLVWLPAGLAVDGCNKCTCRDHSPETAESTYCRYHREGVWDYVEQASQPDEMGAQLTRMERLYNALSDCPSMGCIRSEVGANTLAPGFSAVFGAVDADAEDAAAGSDFSRVDVLLCGLQHGMKDWEDSLKIMGVER